MEEKGAEDETVDDEKEDEGPRRWATGTDTHGARATIGWRTLSVVVLRVYR